MTAEQLRGTLPPGGLGELALRGVDRGVPDALGAHRRPARRCRPASVDVDVDLGDGRRLTGTVAGVYGNRIVSLGYSRLKPKQRLRAWIDLLALSAGHPDEHWTAHAVGRERAGAEARAVRAARPPCPRLAARARRAPRPRPERAAARPDRRPRRRGRRRTPAS